MGICLPPNPTKTTNYINLGRSYNGIKTWPSETTTEAQGTRPLGL